MQRIDRLAPTFLDSIHQVVDDTLDRRLHLLQRARRKDVCDALLPLAVLRRVLQPEHAQTPEVIIRRRLDACRRLTIDGCDGLE